MADEFVEIHGDNWKLEHVRENVEWARQQVWVLERFLDEGEHEHCLICCWTIFCTEDAESGEAYSAGFSQPICKGCYKLFIEKDSNYF